MNSERIYIEGSKYLGLKEVPGPKSNPAIAKMFKLTPSWLDQDDSATAWCGIFRGYIGYDTATGMPKDHYRAANWQNWGVAVNLADAQKGDTVILKRPGGYHVALFSRRSGDYVFLLGGNQGNEVNVSRFHISAIVAIRRG